MPKPRLAVAPQLLAEPLPAEELEPLRAAGPGAIVPLADLLEDEAPDPTTYEREARILLLHALGQNGFVLRPFPAELNEQPANLAGAIALLREQGLVHGTVREPGLTPLGREAAEKLARE